MFSYRCTCVLDDGVTCRPGIRTGCFRLHIGLRSCWEYTFCTDLCVSSAAFAAEPVVRYRVAVIRARG